MTSEINGLPFIKFKQNNIYSKLTKDIEKIEKKLEQKDTSTGKLTTQALGEEGGGSATTQALGEEGGGGATTMALGEEGGGFNSIS